MACLTEPNQPSSLYIFFLGAPCDIAISNYSTDQTETERPWISDSRSIWVPISKAVTELAFPNVRTGSIHHKILLIQTVAFIFFSSLPLILLSSQAQLLPASSVCKHSKFSIAGCPPHRYTYLSCPSPDYSALKLGQKSALVLLWQAGQITHWRCIQNSNHYTDSY